METIETANPNSGEIPRAGRVPGDRGRWRARAVSGWMGVIGLLAAFSWTVLTYRDEPSPGADYLCDFYAYYAGLQFARATGESPYQAWSPFPQVAAGSPIWNFTVGRWGRVPYQFIYPPSAITPLAVFSLTDQPRGSELAWQAANLVGLAAVIALLLAAGGGRDRIVPVLGILVSGPLIETFYLGQITVWMTLLICVYIWGIERNRAFWGGVALGVATTIKVYPLFWAPLVLMRRPALPRAIAGFALGAGAMIGFSLLAHGPESWTRFISDVFLPVSRKPPVGTISLHAYLSPYRDVAEEPGVGIFPILFYLVYFSASVLVALVPARTWPQRRRIALMYTTVILLAMPLTWEHYLVIFVIGLTAEGGIWLGRARGFPITAGLLAFAYALTGGRWLLNLGSGRISEWTLLASRMGVPWVFYALGIAVAVWLIQWTRGEIFPARGSDTGKNSIIGCAVLVAAVALAACVAALNPEWKNSQLGLTAALALPLALRIDASTRRGRMSKPLAA